MHVFFEVLTLRICGILALFAVFIGGCSSPPAPPVPDNNQIVKTVAAGAVAGAAVGSFTGVITAPIGATIGGIIGASIGKAQENKEGVLGELDKDHIKIIKVGENFMFYLPSDAYFYPNSTHINEAFYSGLNDIAEFLSKNETEIIKVSGYTDNIGDKTRNLALSRQQAQNIANYLTRRGLDARIIYSTGYGEQFPVASNDYDEGRASNRRVQISFRIIPKEEI